MKYLAENNRNILFHCSEDQKFKTKVLVLGYGRLRKLIRTRLGEVLVQNNCLFEREKTTDRGTQRKGHVMTVEEIEMMCLQAKECQDCQK